MELKFRNLTKDEIEVRVGAGKSLLLYKTARVDAQLLDEVVGADNWQCKFYQVKETMFCSIGIYNETRHEWVWKDDCGDDDLTMEKVKGEASDSFKRAGFRWGIGRNLYTSPKIKIPDDFEKSQFFEVENVGYAENGDIKDLTITTNFGKDIVFLYKNGRKVSLKGDNTPKTPTTMPSVNLPFDETPTKPQEFNERSMTINPSDLAYLKEYVLSMNNAQSTLFTEWLNKNYFTKNVEMLSEKYGVAVVNKIKAKKGQQNG